MGKKLRVLTGIVLMLTSKPSSSARIHFSLNHTLKGRSSSADDTNNAGLIHYTEH